MLICANIVCLFIYVHVYLHMCTFVLVCIRLFSYVYVCVCMYRFFLSACSSDAANFKSVGRGLLAQLFSASKDLRLFQMTLNLNKQHTILGICYVN